MTKQFDQPSVAVEPFSRADVRTQQAMSLVYIMWLLRSVMLCLRQMQRTNSMWFCMSVMR